MLRITWKSTFFEGLHFCRFYFYSHFLFFIKERLRNSFFFGWIWISFWTSRTLKLSLSENIEVWKCFKSSWIGEMTLERSFAVFCRKMFFIQLSFEILFCLTWNFDHKLRKMQNLFFLSCNKRNELKVIKQSDFVLKHV